MLFHVASLTPVSVRDRQLILTVGVAASDVALRQNEAVARRRGACKPRANCLKLKEITREKLAGRRIPVAARRKLLEAQNDRFAPEGAITDAIAA
ncbi:hypothetical protein JQ604_00255 [Bradyrhizobium jicamae]|uniref:hypothetical protein n=1 Tax=Bradyrhizobium jicamae TaxID=280332 RepID=UPI001BA58BBF|nr:hypothetical protein [Bradyrhizobium jicamae]MBR0750608.1 hypothetical protein [Bradyrhizobium jicamae]